MMLFFECDTNIGNKIIDELKADGWKLKSQYNIFAFDKGIDFDSYVLFKGDEKIEFEWDNWFEWKIMGDGMRVKSLSKTYSLKYSEESE